jgi:hypothetical protein
MPLFNHTNFGDVQRHVYLEGTITRVYLEDSSLPAVKWDTADVEYENHKIFLNALIRYHCTPVGVERENGAVVDGGRGFDVGDKVILMAKIGATPGRGEEYEKMYVVGHRYGVVPCTYNFLLIRISPNIMLPHSPPYGIWQDGVYVPTTPDSHLHEYVTVWDTAKGAPANIYNPVTRQPYVFPVTVEAFKPAFDYYRFTDEELFTLDSQGDVQSPEAGFTPDWLSDIQGIKIRNGTPASSWWTSYDFYANPIFSLLLRTQMALAVDSVGAANGTFASAMTKWNEAAENVAAWKAASPLAFNDQSLEFDVTGSNVSREVPAAVQTRLQELQRIVGEMTDLIDALTVRYSISDTTKIVRWKALYIKEDKTPEEIAEYNLLNGSTLIAIYNAYGQEGTSAASLIAGWEALKNKISGGTALTETELATYGALSLFSAVIQYQQYKARKDEAQAEVDSILSQGSFVPWAKAHDKNMMPLRGRSYHMQTAYGEDEIWVCGKNIYRGIVVSYCDAAWKFVRLENLPPVIPIINTGLENLTGGNVYVPSLGISVAKLFENVSFALASIITVGSDNNIFSWGTLKRINDGGFHRTSHPALKAIGAGSWRLTQNKIPLAPAETTYLTALNTRVEKIDVWSRYDNWMNTMQYSAATYGVDRTWWFRSQAQQWRITATFIDTPIGSLWYSSPVWEVGLWSMSGFRIWDGGPMCRRDAPLRTQFVRQTKHTKRVISQIYIIQRQAVSMWDDPTRTFVKQELNKGIYDHFSVIPKPEVKVQMEMLQATIDFNNTMIGTLNQTTISRYEYLTNKSDRTTAELTELAALRKETVIILYIGYLDAITIAQTTLDAIPEADRPTSSIKYVSAHQDGLNNDDYYTLTAEQQKAIVADRVYVRSQYPGEVGYTAPAALRVNRNEVEIMAACDLYSTLKTNFGQCNPSKQVRNGRLEFEIQKLITKYYADEGMGPKDYSAFKMEARIM